MGKEVKNASKRIGTFIAVLSSLIPFAACWVWALYGLTAKVFFATVVTSLAGFLVGVYFYGKGVMQQQKQH